MKKLLIILVLPLLAAACNKVANTRGINAGQSQSQQSSISVVPADSQSSIQTPAQPSPSTPSVLGASTAAPVKAQKPIQPKAASQAVDNSTALQQAQQDSASAKGVQQQAEQNAAQLQAQQKATQDALDAAKKAQADAEAKAAADAAASQAAAQAQQQAAQQAAQAQANAAAQQKIKQRNTLTAQYNTQFSALEQQIIDIKKQYYIDLADIQSRPEGLAQQQGDEQNLINKDNAAIAQIQLQEQQLYLNYQAQLNALH